MMTIAAETLLRAVEINLAVGRYCVAVRDFSGTAGAVDLRIGLSDRDPALTMGLDAGTGSYAGVTPCTADTPATVLGAGALSQAELSAGISQTGSVASTPYYRFGLSAPTAVTIQAENSAADSLYLSLWARWAALGGK